MNNNSISRRLFTVFCNRKGDLHKIRFLYSWQLFGYHMMAPPVWFVRRDDQREHRRNRRGRDSGTKTKKEVCAPSKTAEYRSDVKSRRGNKKRTPKCPFLAPPVWFEQTTDRLTADCSTAELRRKIWYPAATYSPRTCPSKYHLREGA